MSLIEDQSAHDTLVIRLDEYKGGVGFWGAVPASYDTTRRSMDRGIHVHARDVRGKKKTVDRTYSRVRILGDDLPEDGIFVSEDAAIYYMISTAFGLTPRSVVCPHCSCAHLDEDWFSVHPHQEHHCASCAVTFRTPEPVVGNPLSAVRETCRIPAQTLSPSDKTFDVRQADFKNGILIWGTCPAFLWIGDSPEQEGMHVHAFKHSTETPAFDETCAIVRLDGKELDARMIRLLMAQTSLPMLRDRIITVFCPECQSAQFDVGKNAFTPTSVRTCGECQVEFTSDSEAVSNPALATIEAAAGFAVRPLQRFHLNLPRLGPDNAL